MEQCLLLYHSKKVNYLGRGDLKWDCKGRELLGGELELREVPVKYVWIDGYNFGLEVRHDEQGLVSAKSYLMWFTFSSPDKILHEFSFFLDRENLTQTLILSTDQYFTL